MASEAQDAYLEDKVTSADPIELVSMLYDSALFAVRDGRRHLAAGDIGARCRAVSKACGILLELAASLDRERGGELSGRLMELYDYMLRRLRDGNYEQRDRPFEEVEEILQSLGEAWRGVRPAVERGDARPRLEAAEDYAPSPEGHLSRMFDPAPESEARGRWLNG